MEEKRAMVSTSPVRTVFRVERSIEFPNFIMDVLGRVEVCAPDTCDTEWTQIGITRGKWAPHWNSEEVDLLISAMDSYSSDALALAEVTQRYVEGLDEWNDSWLGVEYIELDEGWRGANISYFVMADWIDTFCAGHGMVSITVPHKPKAKEKLGRHWLSFGFEPVTREDGSTAGFIVNRTFRPPTGCWVDRFLRSSAYGHEVWVFDDPNHPWCLAGEVDMSVPSES